MKPAANIWIYLRIGIVGIGVVVSLAAGALSVSAQLPPDVRSNHWAAGAVAQIVKSGVMTVYPDHEFKGEEHVTHAQAVIALAEVAKRLEAGTWQAGDAKPVPDKIAKVLTKSAWQSKLVTRYDLASVLVRFGNYYLKAVSRPNPGAKDLGKSVTLPTIVKIPQSVNASNPAYGALKYLTQGRMISADSPLIKADNVHTKAVELSHAIAQVVDGLADRMTELGLDEMGNTPDKSFHQSKTPKK